jgi:hypothetical protein
MDKKFPVPAKALTSVFVKQVLAALQRVPFLAERKRPLPKVPAKSLAKSEGPLNPT